MIKKNIIANVFGRAWGVVSVYLFVPLYLKFLGIEVYGLVGFYSTLLGVLAFADMGFTATLSREMARLSVIENSDADMRDLLRTYELTYFYISAGIAVVIWVLAPLISEYWLQSRVLPPHEMAAAIRLMGIAIAFQLPTGLFIGGLTGLQRQVQANYLGIAWSIFRGLGAVVVLWLFSPTIYAFTVWQVFSNAVYCFFARFSLWKSLSVVVCKKPHFNRVVLKNTWRYAAAMAGSSCLSIILTQTDKLVVSKMLSLEMLGYYTLAGTLASVPPMLASPIASAVFPRLTGLVALKDYYGIAQLYHRSCKLVSVAIIPGGLTLVLFAGDFLFAWTGSASTASGAGLTSSLLIVGQLLQTIMVMPYYLALSFGHVRLTLQMGIVTVVLITPLTILLVMKFGVIGGGMAWLIMNICVLPPSMFILHNRLLPGELKTWVLRDVGLPLLAALPTVLIARWFVPRTDSRLLTLCFLGLVCVVLVIVTLITVPELRNNFIKQARRLCGLSFVA